MPLNHELPDYTFILRAADGYSAKVNDRVLQASFLLAPNQLVEAWNPDDPNALSPEDMAPLLAMNPELILLGTGERQAFPAAAVMAACLTPVSYTHLDVYKRQGLPGAALPQARPHPVSYTHLDVYKRQLPGRSGAGTS